MINEQQKKKIKVKNKKGIDPEVNKIVSYAEKSEKKKKCFMRYTKLTCVRATLNRRSIELALTV